LRVGRRLLVRSGAEVERQIVSGSPAQVSANTQTPAVSVAKAVSAAKATPAVSATPAASANVYHTVRRGDTLSSIARRYGTTIDSLCRLNGITPQTILSVGRRLVVRSGT